MEAWLIAVIAVGSAIFLGLTIFFMWRCCSSRRRKETFKWIERLGIPFAKEGTPDKSAFPPPKHYRVQLHVKQEIVGVENGGLQLNDDKSSSLKRDNNNIFYSEDDNEADSHDPFKRLDTLGIPRARREQSPDTVRPPSRPLPSPVPDYESSSGDEEQK